MKELIRILLTFFLGIIYRVKIVDKKNVPLKGPAVLCSNHLSEMDMIFIGYRIKRLIRWMAKDELFRNPIISRFLRWLGAFPVKRGKADIESIRFALKLLAEGHIIGVFPEGTRTRHKDSKSIRIHSGAAMIASRAGVPVIPVAIEGSYKPFSKVKVVFGEPFYLKDAEEGKLSKEELSEASRYIMSKVYELLEVE